MNHIKSLCFMYLFILFVNNHGSEFTLRDNLRVKENPEIVLNKVKKIKNFPRHILMEIYDFCDDNYKSGKSIKINNRDLNSETIEILEKSELSDNRIMTCDTAKIILKCFKLDCYCFCNRITLVHPVTGKEIIEEEESECIIQ